MSVVKFIPYTNRLSKLVKAPGGKRIEAAIADAQNNLRQIEGDCLSAVDERIAEIRALACLTRPNPSDFEDMYRASNEIVGLGGVFALSDLSQAAYSLCDLIDRSRQRGAPDAEALRVHVDSLRVLRLGEALTPEQRRQILDGLAEVVGRTTREGATATAG